MYNISSIKESWWP